MEDVDLVIKNRRGSAALWASKNSVLNDGEIGVESDTGKFKMGPGRWNDLSYFINTDGIAMMISDALAGFDPGSGGDAGAALTTHINSLLPHPVYDDGPSLALLYENAKV